MYTLEKLFRKASSRLYPRKLTVNERFEIKTYTHFCISWTSANIFVGGSRCRMSIIRNGNVALSNLRTPPLSHVRPKKGSVALSILGVYTRICPGVGNCKVILIEDLSTKRQESEPRGPMVI